MKKIVKNISKKYFQKNKFPANLILKSRKKFKVKNYSYWLIKIKEVIKVNLNL